MAQQNMTEEKIWQVEARIPPDIDNDLSKFPAIIRQILYNRGISDHDSALQYFQAEPPNRIREATLLGLDQSVDRIAYAINRQQSIVVYGDYDVDGVTATALMTLALEAVGADVRPYIPNRFDEGYGLNVDALDALRSEGTDLIITVDCGIRSPEEVAYARQLGMEMIITDHHHPGPTLPPAFSVVNPKQSGDLYPEKELAGVGLAYKIVEALFPYLEANYVESADYLDLVALGTVADLAPLRGENRSLVRRGLKTLKSTTRQGLLSLMMVSRVVPARVTASNIGFALGPRLNAAGRLESAMDALNLLLTNDVFTAGQLAQQLEIQNQERRRITADIQETAENMALAEEEEPWLLFAAHPDFNPGVVGLAASRLADAYYRPAIVAHQGETETRGSCRSIDEFHITEALDECQDLLVRHGGHAAAAGFTVENKNLPELKTRLKEIAARQLQNLDLRPTLVADKEVALHHLKPELLHYLDLLEPTGYGNRQPHFISRDVMVTHKRVVGRDNSHLKLAVTDGLVTFDAIAFRQGHWYERMPSKLDLLFTFELNEFNGRQSLQLNIKDLKPAS